MSVQATRGRGLVAAALTSVAGWLVEPGPASLGMESDVGRVPGRRVIAVAGLRRRSGVTTVARAIGAELAARDPGGACAVSCDHSRVSVPLGLPAAGRLARVLGPLVDGHTRACGRLCLVEGGEPVSLCGTCRDLTPLVLDVSDPADAAAAASLADHVILVAGPDSEPSLACVVAESLAMVGPPPTVVLNRCGRASERWQKGSHARVPESRMAAQLAAAGREPRGAMGQVMALLAEQWEQP